MIIQEQDIEQHLNQVESVEGIAEQWLDAFNQELEDYVAYLDQEVLNLLDEAERDLLLFIHSVIYQILRTKKPGIQIELHAFFDQEEKNWGIYENEIKEDFNKRLDTFYEIYDEEEALAFIEDSLTEDEENEVQISAVGRDIIWNVTCAFLILMTRQVG